MPELFIFLGTKRRTADKPNALSMAIFREEVATCVKPRSIDIEE